jgi:hypothetical protein
MRERAQLDYSGGGGVAVVGPLLVAGQAASVHRSAALSVVRSGGLRSLANHTVLAHGVYAHELRELAGLAHDAPLCSPGLSERHRELAHDQDPSRWLDRPEVRAAAAATREANYDDQQRRRRVAQLNAVRQKAIDASRRSLQAEKDDPELAVARRRSRSRAQEIPRGSGMPDLWCLVLHRRPARSGLPAAQVL